MRSSGISAITPGSSTSRHSGRRRTALAPQRRCAQQPTPTTSSGNEGYVSPSALIWITSAHTLVVASLVLSAGTLGNLFGRKRMFCVGVVVMVAGGLLAATADTTAVVSAAQLISGLGGALILRPRTAI